MKNINFKLLKISESIDACIGKPFEDMKKKVEEIHKLLWQLIPIAWLLIIILTITLYKHVEILKLCYGLVGATLLALGNLMSSKGILDLGSGFHDYSPPIMKSLLKNVIKNSLGLFLVLFSLII